MRSLLKRALQNQGPNLILWGSYLGPSSSETTHHDCGPLTAAAARIPNYCQPYVFGYRAWSMSFWGFGFRVTLALKQAPFSKTLLFK